MKTFKSPLSFIAAAILAFGMTGCDRLGIPDPAKEAAANEAESKALGAGCRNAGRGLVECYQIYPKADKAAMFTGWKEMNEYMMQNKMEVIVPPPPPPPPPAPVKPKSEDEAAQGEAADGEEKPAEKHGKDT